MKKKIVILLFLFPFLSYSQKNLSVELILGIDGGSINTGHLVPRPPDSHSGDSKLELGYRIGINLNYELVQNFYIKSGVRYANLGHYFLYAENLRWPSEISADGTLTPDPTLPHVFRYRREFGFIEMPIIFQYGKSNRKWNLFYEAGLSLYFNVGAKEIQNTDLSNEINNIPFEGRNPQISMNFSFGVNHHLGEHLSIFFQPIFRLHVTKINHSSLVKDYLMSVGLEMGFRMGIF